jgi:hypothetical protein
MSAHCCLLIDSFYMLGVLRHLNRAYPYKQLLLSIDSMFAAVKETLLAGNIPYYC